MRGAWVFNWALFKRPTLLFLLSLAIAIFVFLKNAWVGEDSYIVFRSIEQLFAGNGPIWNPHERVQVFTSPLWFVVLALARIFSQDVYLNVIVVSLILWLSTLFVLKAVHKNDMILLISILLLSSSPGFFDYTSSGLENVLAYLIIATYILNYVGLFVLDNSNHLRQISVERRIQIILFLFGLVICVRHDLALLLLPPTIYVVLKNLQVFSKKQWAVFSIISLLPFLLFSLFSLVYYGFLFPNTAYAKLNTGLHQMEVFKRGIDYFISSFKYDTATLVVILGSLVLYSLNSSEKFLRYLGYGVLLNLFYVGYVGGDFMQGRFLSYAYMVSVILILLRLEKIHLPKFKALTLITVGFYLVLYPHTPFNSPLSYKNQVIEMGVADERGFYFDELSLYQYFIRNREDNFFPEHRWAKSGYQEKQSPYSVIVLRNVGMFGYYSGTEKIIIDPLALTDPLLARLPVTGKWRIGHFVRKVPDGYIDSLVNGNESIVDPQVNEFYKKLKIVTQNKELFTLERLKTIALFNMGAYNHLLLDE